MRMQTKFTCITATLRLVAVLFVTSCSGDDPGGDGGAAASSGAGSGGAGSGGAGNGGGSGDGGGGGTGGVNGGDSGSDASTQDAGDDAGADAGPDAGTQPMAAVCSAPVPATNPGNTCPGPTADPVALEATLVKSGLDAPVFLTHAPGDATRLFVVERSGRIVILDPASGEEISDFLNLQAMDPHPFIYGSSAGSEYGLLGLAFHPDYPADPRFFIHYVAQALDNEIVVSAFEVSASDPNTADPDSEQTVIGFGHPGQLNHNGGMLAFGPDNCLYIASGDGGGSNDNWTGVPEGHGQNLDTELGKILRVDVDAPETGAPGNLTGAGIPHIWDYGLRNPWRFSFDRTSGDLYVGDVGQGAWEEIDVEPAGTGHKNYGWKIAEGNHCRGGGGGCGGMSGLEPAVDEYPNVENDQTCVIGGYVYRGSAIASLQGWYVFGDNGPSRRIRAFVWDGAGRCNDRTVVLGEQGGADALDLDANITSFGEDASGELYITTLSSVYRIEAE